MAPAICVAPEVNEILSLANLALSNLSLFLRVTQIGSALMVVACTACANAALTKLCIAPESIKTVLQYTHSILWVIPRIVTSSNGFCQIHKHRANANSKKTHVFFSTYHCMSIFSVVPTLISQTWLLWSRWL